MNLLLATNIILELLIVVRLWKTIQRAYAGFAVYLLISTISSTFLLALSIMQLAPQYRATWIITELILAIPGGVISWEAVRNLRRVGKQLPDAITVMAAIGVMAALVVWGYSHYGYAYDRALEQCFAIKASIEFFFSVMLVSMLVTGHIPGRVRSLEFRHGVLLAGYFLLNSFTFFGYGLASARDRMYDFKPLSYFLLITCTVCLIGWLEIFGRRKPA
jgi:hypothetical protein